MQERNRGSDWLAALAADAAARADSLASSLAADALEHPDDQDLAAWCGLADRVSRDLDRLVLELDDSTPGVVHLRSRTAAA